jgi:hypothetical protein
LIVEKTLSTIFRRTEKQLRLGSTSNDGVVVRGLCKTAFKGIRFAGFETFPAGLRKFFREWGCKKLGTAEFWAGLAAISAQTNYDEWHFRLANDLSDYWSYRMGENLAFGPGRKLINLLMKEVARSESIEDARRGSLIERLHIPFDEYSLVAIRNCIGSVRIPSKPAMGYVANQELYSTLQSDCRIVAREADVSPIFIDIAAWNYNHPRHQA